nr:MAG TPA_asm: hypothetical protein [Caudoviricetes sp.]
MVEYPSKESSYGLCRARLAGSGLPGYTLNRFVLKNESRF